MLRKILLGAAIASFSFVAQAQVKIGVIASSTGPVAQIGIQHKNTVPLLPKKVGDVGIEYIFLDDGSDPTQTTKIVQKFLIEDKVDAIIGPSGTPNAMAILPFIAEAKTPLLAAVGSAAVILPMDDKKRWVFKTSANDDLIAKALVDHMKANGVKTVGVIAGNDPFGENWAKTFGRLAAEAGIKITADERYGRGDSSVTGQALKILAAAPDAVLVASPGAPAVLPQVTLFDQGYKGKMYQTHGAGTPEFLKLGGNKVEGTLMAVSPMLVLTQLPDSMPFKKVALDYGNAYKALHGTEPGTFGGNVFDAGLLLQEALPAALKTAKPGTPEFRAALRDAIEKTKELVATQGYYTMTPEDHSGFDERGRVMVTVKDNKWILLK
jgi:branched-chain amino acid transport system substrate-binding protein